MGAREGIGRCVCGGGGGGGRKMDIKTERVVYGSGLTFVSSTLILF